MIDNAIHYIKYCYLSLFITSKSSYIDKIDYRNIKNVLAFTTIEKSKYFNKYM